MSAAPGAPVASRFSGPLIALHWLVGLAALGQISLGWWMLSLPKAPPGLRAGWFNVHKSIGITIGLVMIIRLVVRLRGRAPLYPAQMPGWQQQAARLAHVLFYFCLLALPLSGYLGSSFTRYPIRFYGMALPHWGWDAPALKELCSVVHLSCVWLLMALVTVHVAAAFKHLLVDRDGVFFNIWPRGVGGARSVLMKCITAIFLALFPLLATAQTAYVANEKTGTLSLIDTARDAVVGEIRAGTKPRGMAVSRDGSRIYVSDQPSSSLLVVDIARRAVTATIPLGESPEGVGISPDGAWVVAAVEVSNGVAFVDTAKNAVSHFVKTEGKNPEHAIFSPDGKWVYVSAEDADTVDVIDVAARRQAHSIKVGMRPRGIAFTPDGKRAYVACEIANTVFAIDVATHAVIASIPAGKFSNGVAIRPDGARVYISNGRDATVSVIDTATNTIVATVPVGQRPWNMAIKSDGSKLYVANGRSNSVSVIDTATNARARDISVGELPWGVVVR